MIYQLSSTSISNPIKHFKYILLLLPLLYYSCTDDILQDLDTVAAQNEEQDARLDSLLTILTDQQAYIDSLNNIIETYSGMKVSSTSLSILAENFSVFSASEGKQYSAAYPEKFHGLFTYFLLKGLQGSAKGDDKNLTIGELYDYVKENVSSQAGYLDKEQDPTFIGTNKDKVLVSY